jgi:riboflavin biosynthesis pyrimidine reductase
VLATLLDRTEGGAVPLPAELVTRYGGPLRFPATDRPFVFANFVSTIDGVVSYALPGRAQASLISGGHPADRFVLALLRAAADAVVVGAGTLRSEPGVIWSPEAAFPEGGRAFAELRAATHRAARALTVLVTGSGRIDLDAPALAEGAPVVILTTEKGAAALGKVEPHIRVRLLARGTAEEMVAIAAAESGGRSILTEGGPTLFGQFLRERAVDELFLTIAPRIAGRAPDQARTSLVERSAFSPEDAPETRLLSAKSADDLLLLRYAMR